MDPHLDPHFTFLYQLLKDNYSDYSYYIFSTTSAILLVIGWLLTSKDARSYVSEHVEIKVLFIIVIVFFLLAEVLLSTGAWSTSTTLLTLLREAVIKSADPRITEQYYESRAVPLSGVIIFVFAHLLLYSILVWIVCSIRKS